MKRKLIFICLFFNLCFSLVEKEDNFVLYSDYPLSKIKEGIDSHKLQGVYSENLKKINSYFQRTIFSVVGLGFHFGRDKVRYCVGIVLDPFLKDQDKIIQEVRSEENLSGITRDDINEEIINDSYILTAKKCSDTITTGLKFLETVHNLSSIDIYTIGLRNAQNNLEMTRDQTVNLNLDKMVNFPYAEFDIFRAQDDSSTILIKVRNGFVHKLMEAPVDLPNSPLFVPLIISDFDIQKVYESFINEAEINHNGTANFKPMVIDSHQGDSLPIQSYYTVGINKLRHIHNGIPVQLRWTLIDPLKLHMSYGYQRGIKSYDDLFTTEDVPYDFDSSYIYRTPESTENFDKDLDAFGFPLFHCNALEGIANGCTPIGLLQNKGQVVLANGKNIPALFYAPYDIKIKNSHAPVVEFGNNTIIPIDYINKNWVSIILSYNQVDPFRTVARGLDFYSNWNGIPSVVVRDEPTEVKQKEEVRQPRPRRRKKVKKTKYDDDSDEIEVEHMPTRRSSTATEDNTGLLATPNN